MYLNSLLLVYGNANYFCILIHYIVIFLNLLLNSDNLYSDSFGFSIIILSPANSDRFLCFLPLPLLILSNINHTFFPLLVLLMLARTSSAILNRSKFRGVTFKKRNKVIWRKDQIELLEIKILRLSSIEGLNSKLETATLKIREWKIDLKKLTRMENVEHRYREMKNVKGD